MANLKSRVALRAYIAGIIDGEGYVGVMRRVPTKANKMVTPCYSAYVSVEMTDRGPVELIAKFCKTEQKIKERVRKDGYKTLYGVHFSHFQAVELLREILPYLIVKRRQADLALKLFELKKDSRRHRTKVAGIHQFRGGRHKGKSYRVFAQSDEFVALQESLYQQNLIGAARSGKGAAFR